MSGPRITILALVCFIAYLAIIVRALQTPSDWWASTSCSIAFVTLGVAALGAVVLRGGDRAFALGAACFGWAYLAFVFAPGLKATFGPLLLTTHLLPVIGVVAFGHSGSNRLELFATIGHAIVAIVLAFAGGAIGRSMVRPSPSRGPERRLDAD